MLDWLRRKRGPPPSVSEHPLRATLFGDVPIDVWSTGKTGEPWATFATAAKNLTAGDHSSAGNSLKAVLGMSGLESRHYLQAWTTLRQLGIQPTEDRAKHVYGVVLDVPMPQGFDTLAGYEDQSARYLNFSGAAIVWEHPDGSLNSHIDELMKGGHSLARKIGPWEGPRPGLSAGQARISVLTPSGIHFGQGPFNLIAGDPMGSRAIDAATSLMQALIAKANATRGTSA